MRIDVVTLFPDMIRERSAYGVQGRALESGVLELHTWNPRDCTLDRHRAVDDRRIKLPTEVVRRWDPPSPARRIPLKFSEVTCHRQAGIPPFRARPKFP